MKVFVRVTPILCAIAALLVLGLSVVGGAQQAPQTPPPAPMVRRQQPDHAAGTAATGGRVMGDACRKRQVVHHQKPVCAGQWEPAALSRPGSHT